MRACFRAARVELTNRTLKVLIQTAYTLQDFQIAGGPDWLNTTRFDIVATAGGTVAQAELQMMLRDLLADRFKLAVHTEAREMPIYALTRARADGKPGPQLRASELDCVARRLAPPPAGRAGRSGAAVWLRGGRRERRRARVSAVAARGQLVDDAAADSGGSHRAQRPIRFRPHVDTRPDAAAGRRRPAASICPGSIQTARRFSPRFRNSWGSSSSRPGRPSRCSWSIARSYQRKTDPIRLCRCRKADD